MRHNPLDNYRECSVCNKILTKDWMMYDKPEILGRDYFPEIGNICSKCVWKELDRMLKDFAIPKGKNGDAKWIKKNICKLTRGEFRLEKKIETILFLCSVILNNKDE